MTDAPSNRNSRNASRNSKGFTLIEMLTVISIIAVICAFSLPVLKNFGKSAVNVSASRQLLDDIGHARQLAMSQRTTVYMVFVPTNFWVNNNLFGYLQSNGTTNQLLTATNLLDKQLTGYTLMAYGAMGDQPGQHQWHYLETWQSLPNGAFIPMWKFYNNVNPGFSFNFSDPVNANNYFNISSFSTNTFPFPTEDVTTPTLLPYIAFNYLGQLCDFSGQLLNSQSAQNEFLDFDNDFVGGGIDIPLAAGNMMSPRDPTTHALAIGNPVVYEMPPGNSTNISYNVIHIDPLTGRATQEFHKMQ